MYKDKSICVVIPAYNEETQIGKVIETMPDYVDRIVIVDDDSSDETVQVVKRYQQGNDRTVLIKHENNEG
ncbi:MAG: glycosyltransferase, partial [Desulfobacterales bacterium]|nr:glycosyltransferase [Desulfobacterales bacterium]